MKKRLQYSYDVAQKESTKKGQKYKGHYDSKVRYSKLEVGDRVLVRNVSVRGKNKLGDKWERNPYIVIEKPNLDLPVFKVQQEENKGPIRALHRNLLLPFMSIDENQSRSEELETRRVKVNKKVKVKCGKHWSRSVRQVRVRQRLF